MVCELGWPCVSLLCSVCVATAKINPDAHAGISRGRPVFGDLCADEGAARTHVRKSNQRGAKSLLRLFGRGLRGRAAETAATDVDAPLSAGFRVFVSSVVLVALSRGLAWAGVRLLYSVCVAIAKINPDAHASISWGRPVFGDPRVLARAPPGHWHAQPHKGNEIIITGVWPGIAGATRRRLQVQRWAYHFQQDSAGFSLVHCSLKRHACLRIGREAVP